MITDMHGRPLDAGAHVEAWRDGDRYTGIVQRIDPACTGSSYHPVVIIRDSDDAEMGSFSDAIGILPE